MFENITIGQYYPGDSLIHRIDPRAKIIAAFIYMVSLFVVNNVIGYILIIGAGISVILLSHIPFDYILRGLRPIFFLIVITFLLNIILTPGEALLQLGPLSITGEGVSLGAFMAVRLMLLVLMASLVSLTTTPINLTEGIERLLSPFKIIGVPAHEIAMMMSIALRFIPTLLEETDRIVKAQLARGADFEGGNLIKRAKSLMPVLVPLFVSSFRRADELATAMEARCYRGGEGRTRIKELEFKLLDKGVLVTVFCFLLATIISRWWYY